MEEVGYKTGRRGLRAPTMEGAAEAAPAPGCSSLSGSLSASASSRWPPTPPLPAPPSLTDPRWPPLSFLCCLRVPEVTTSPLPELGQSARPEEAGRAAVARGDLALSGAEWAVPKAGKGWPSRLAAGAVGSPRPELAGTPQKSRQTARGGCLSLTDRLAFTVLIERRLCAKAVVASPKSWGRAAPNRVLTAIVGPGPRGGAEFLHH